MYNVCDVRPSNKMFLEIISTVSKICLGFKLKDRNFNDIISQKILVGMLQNLAVISADFFFFKLNIKPSATRKKIDSTHYVYKGIAAVS